MSAPPIPVTALCSLQKAPDGRDVLVSLARKLKFGAKIPKVWGRIYRGLFCVCVYETD